MAGKEYQMMFQIGARLQGQGAFKSAQANITALQREVMSLSKQQGDIAAYQKQQKAVDKTRERLKLLQEQYKILKDEMDKNGEASASLKMKVAEKESKINSETRALQENEAALQAQGNALQEAGINTNNLSSASQELASQLENLRSEQEAADQAAQEMGTSMAEGAEAIAEMVAAAGMMKVFQAGYEALRQCTEASIEFESSMAAVKRTVGGSDAFLAQLGEDFKALSTEIPITTQDLTQIATTAGQLGIAQDKVQSFTEVMAKLATTTDLSAESAATMLAQFANITGLTDYERLGSVVAELGDATATTASKVVEMSQGMAAAASQAGMSSTDIMTISAAVGSLGIEAQAGSTSMSTLISTLYKAIETGEGLENFASIANMTADQFKKAWGENAVGAMNAFIQGLNDTERNGKSAIVILDELGITNVRQTKAILGLASAGSLLSNTIAQANNAWTQNTALTAKASVMYGATESKLVMLGNGFNNLKIAIGDAFTPAVGAGAAALTDLMRPVTEFIQKNPALVRAVTAGIGVIAAATVGIVGFTAVVRIATKVNAMFTASMAATLGPVLAIAAGIAAVTAGVILLADAFKTSQESMEDLDAEFDGLNADFRKQSHIRSLCSEYKQLQSELHNTAGATEELTGLDKKTVTIKVTAAIAEGFTHLTSDDFVDNYVVQITGEEDKNHLIKAVEFLDGTEGAWIALSGKVADNGKVDTKSFINDLIDNNAVVKLSGKALEEVSAQGFLKPGEDTVPLKALPETITASQFFTDALADGTAQIGLTPAVANTLDRYKLLDDPKAIITLSAKAQGKMVNAEEFMIGKTVPLTAHAIRSLYAQGFLKGDDIIYLNGGVKNDGKLNADKFFVGDKSVKITGVPDGTITVSQYIDESDRVVSLTAEITNQEDIQKAIASLKDEAKIAQADAATAKADLQAAQADLAVLENREQELQNRLSAAQTEAGKATLKQQIEEQTKAIENQKTKVSELETAYVSNATQYAIVQSAVEELTAKEQHLASVKAELAEATGLETAEIEKQIEAQDQLAAKKQAEIRQDARSNITKQAKQYATAMWDATNGQKELNNVLQQTSKYQDYMASGADGVKQAVIDARDAILALSDHNGINWESSEVKAYANEISNLWKLATGQGFDVKGRFNALTTGREIENVHWEYATEGYDELIISASQYQEAINEANAVQQAFIDNLVAGVMEGGMSIEEMESLLHTALDDTYGGAEIAKRAIYEVKNAIKEAESASEEASTATQATAVEVTTAIQPILDKMTDLGKAYEEAYDAAYKSMEGQFKLFEKAPEVTMSSMDEMIAGLESQAQYMAQYNENLQLLQGKGINKDLLASLADGSAESAAAIAAMVDDVANNGSQKIDELNAAFESVQAGKDKFAQTVAEMQTEFSAQMQQLSTELSATVTSMDMSSEAADAGLATVEAFAKGAENGIGAVKAAFAAVSAAAQIIFKLPGHAAGTDNADRGFAMVGERGPELVWFNGGEKVMNAQETEAYRQQHTIEAQPVSAASGSAGSGSTYHIEVKPEYNINGNADPATLQPIFDQQTINLRNLIEETIADIESDRERSVYSR